MAEHIFDEMKRYMRFGSTEEQALCELGPLIEPHIGLVIDEFYARIEEHPGAMAVISGGAAQVQRLKQTLRQWLAELFVGPWDLSYFEHRALIGRRHVVIQLPLHYNFTAMDLVRNHLLRLTVEAGGDPGVIGRRTLAVNKLIDLELAIILHTYSEDFDAQLRRQERLATFGQMTSAISHELRNPLGVIESSVFLLRRRVGDDPAAVRHIDKIQAQVARSNRIITSLLDIVRGRPPVWVRVSPVHLAEAAISALHEATGYAVQLHAEGDPPAVFVDPERIQQVLLNLLSNAADAAGKGGIVRLELRRHEGEVEFLVSDSGPGVDPSVKSRIFEPLVTTKEKGIGLGLALCRKLVEAHQGVLELVPARDLPGAAFSLRLRAEG
jgi:two-component system sensor histidine kinase HydH